MVNEVAYNQVGQTSPDEQAQGRIVLGRPMDPANNMAASIGTSQNRTKIYCHRSCDATRIGFRQT